MSKIFRALEKAERENKKDLFAIFGPEEKAVEPKEIILETQEVNGAISDHRLISLSQPGSVGAEQFRKLRTYLLRFNFSNQLRTIMVTSSTDSEGKSFVAANLAVGIAHDLNAQALLLECDLRNPTLSRWFGVQNGKGLSDYLLGNEKVSEFLIKTGVEKLSVISAGSIQDNPTELLGSKKMEALVYELRHRYNDRYLILDSTPLLATTEPEVLAKLVDGIIIVVRAGITPRETVQQAIGCLEKEKIIGVVLNDVTFKSSGLHKRYFGSDGYYYRYGYGKRNLEPENHWRKLFQFIKKSHRK